jgi:hypothetical protein
LPDTPPVLAYDRIGHGFQNTGIDCLLNLRTLRPQHGTTIAPDDCSSVIAVPVEMWRLDHYGGVRYWMAKQATHADQDFSAEPTASRG